MCRSRPTPVAPDPRRSESIIDAWILDAVRTPRGRG
ncbi:hypothetical protein, partial [Mycobacterium senriense]